MTGVLVTRETLVEILKKEKLRFKQVQMKNNLLGITIKVYCKMEMRTSFVSSSSRYRLKLCSNSEFNRVQLTGILNHILVMLHQVNYKSLH